MMMMTLCGNLGRDAEERQAGSDTVVAFNVGVNTKVKQEKVTTWVRCSLWGKRGQALAQYLKAGTKVCVVGELSTSTYEKDGSTKFSLDVRVSDISLMGSGKEDEPSRPATKQIARQVREEDIPF